MPNQGHSISPIPRPKILSARGISLYPMEIEQESWDVSLLQPKISVASEATIISPRISVASGITIINPVIYNVQAELLFRLISEAFQET